MEGGSSELTKGDTRQFVKISGIQNQHVAMIMRGPIVMEYTGQAKNHTILFVGGTRARDKDRFGTDIRMVRIRLPHRFLTIQQIDPLDTIAFPLLASHTRHIVVEVHISVILELVPRMDSCKLGILGQDTVAGRWCFFIQDHRVSTQITKGGQCARWRPTKKKKKSG